jgi:hypothetical protein
LFDTTDDQVVKRARCIDAGLTWHVRLFPRWL